MSERVEVTPKGLLELPENIREKILSNLLSLGSLSIPGLDSISAFADHPHDDGGNGISIYFRLAIYLINLLSAEDPSQLHYSISREVLKQIGGQELEGNERARDLLARELVKECKVFAAEVIPLGFLQESHESRSLFVITQKDEWAKHLVYAIDGNLWLDWLFFRHLGNIGGSGKQRAERLSQASKKWMLEFREDKKASKLFRIWIDTAISACSCRFPRILAEVIWSERVKSLFELGKNNVPALTQGFYPIVVKILSPKTEAKEIEQRLQMVHEGKIIATIPTIDPGILRTVTKGAEKLTSFYHHLLIRHECRVGFENWVSGEKDMRVVRYEGGYSEIVKRLGLTSSRAVEEIKNLLHAQAYMNFHFEDGSNGNLIVLSKFRSRKCCRDDGVSIVLGFQLLPHYTFQESRRGKLLIPIPELPPLISSSNSHAGQAALQMSVMEMFAKQSIEFAENGSIEIREEVWARLSIEAGLSKLILKQTLDRWVNDGDDGPKFLVPKGDNRYSFGPAYQKEETFLKEQGLLRKKNRANGKKAVKAKQRNKKR